MMPAFVGMLKEDRQRRGVHGRPGRLLRSVSPQEYRELEAGTAWPSFDTWEAICKLYGWPQRFVGRVNS